MILVTGYKGFVGSALMNHLMLTEEYQGDGLFGLEKESSCEKWYRKLDEITGDNPVDVVLACGAISDNQYKGLDIFDWNVYTAKVLAAHCAHRGIYMVYISSQTARDPKTLYGHTKKLAEFMVKDTPGLDACILQPFNIWSEDESMKPPQCQSLPHRLLKQNLEVLWETERDYVHVLDVVEAIRLAAYHRTAGTYHVGTGKSTTSIELARCIECKGYTKEPTPDNIEKYTCADPNRFLPGWQPTIDVLGRLSS